MNFFQLLIFLFFTVVSFEAFSAGGTYPQGDKVRFLKDIWITKNTNIQFITGDSDDPQSVAKDAVQGSIYVRSGTGDLYVKQDNGSSTNWTPIVGSSLPAFTQGSVPFANALGELTEDPVNLFWDDVQDFLGIGTNTPGVELDVNGSFRLGATTIIDSILDEDDFVSNSATAVPTQQSVKAYVDTGDAARVVGPASSTDNAITRYDGATGKLVQDSLLFLDDNGDLQYTAGSGTGLDIFANTVDTSDTGAATFSGGGTSDRSRGASVRAYGNEHPSSNAGDLNIGLGNVAGSQFRVFCADNTQCINIDGATGAHTFGKSASPTSHVMYGNLTQTSSVDVTQTITTTGAGNSATLDITSQPGGADARIRHNIDGTVSYTMGIDNSMSDRWAMSYNNTLGTADWLTVDTSGNVSILNSVIGQVGATPSADTVFEVVSTSEGSIPCPKMTEAQRDAIVSPQQGQCVYNTSVPVLNVYNGTSWVSAGGGLNKWTASTNYKTNDVVWLETDNNIYRALSDFTSGPTFTPANWQELSDDVNSTGTIVDNRIARFDGTTGKLIQSSDLELTDAGNIRHTNGGFNIRASTLDASDTSNTSLWGGGGTDISRGSGLSVYGNEHATYPGVVRLKTGDAAGGKLSVECNGVECLAANNAGAVSIGATGGTQTHTVNGNLDVLGEADVTVNSANPALAITQSGVGDALDVAGNVNVTGQTDQDGAFNLTGLMTITETVAGLLLDVLDTTGLISLFKVDQDGPKKETASGDVLIGRDKKFNMLLDPSFEIGVSEGTCTSCTASSETSVRLGAPENTKSLKMAFSASTGDYTVTKTTGSEYSTAQMYGGCWIKTSAAGVKFHVRSNGANILDVDVDSSDVWKWYALNFVAGTTSVGYQVEASASITDDIYVDECFLGASDETYQYSGAEYLGFSKLQGNASCEFTTSSATYTGFAADTDCGAQTSGKSIQVPSTKKLAFMSVTGGFPAGTYKIDMVMSTANITTGAISTCKMVAGTNESTEYVMRTRDSSTDPYKSLLTFSLDLLQGFNGEIELQCKVTAGTLTFLNISTSEFSLFDVYYFPPKQDALSSINNNTTTTKVLSADVTTVTTISDLTFSNMIVGAEYEVVISPKFQLGGNGNMTLSVNHNGSVINRATYSHTAATSLITSPSLVTKFIASASTLTFSIDAISTGALAGNGTQSETFAQLRRIDGQFNATLRDVVKSPGSSNGKPVSYSFHVDASGNLTDIVGDIGISTCTIGANTTTCAPSGKFLATPSCQVTEDKATASQVMANYHYTNSTASSLVFPFTLSTTGASTTPIAITVECTGLAP